MYVLVRIKDKPCLRLVLSRQNNRQIAAVKKLEVVMKQIVMIVRGVMKPRANGEAMSNSQYFESVPSQSNLYPVAGFQDGAAIEITKLDKVNSLTRRLDHEFDAPLPAELRNVRSSCDPFVVLRCY